MGAFWKYPRIYENNEKCGVGERSHQNLGFLCLRLLCNSPVNGSDADELCWPIVTPLVFFSIKSTTWSKNIWLRSFRSRNWCAAIQGSSTDSNEDSWVTHVQRKHFISSFTPHNLSQLSQNFCVILIFISSGKSNLFQVVSPHCKFASTAFASSLPYVKQVRPTFTSLSPKRSTRPLASSPQNVFISCRNFPDMFRPTCNLCTAIKNR